MKFQKKILINNLYPNGKYCFDTSAFIAAWKYYYKKVVFSKLWEDIRDLIEKGKILVPYTVWEEIQRKKDDLYEFFRESSKLFVQPIIEEQELITELSNRDDIPWGKGDSEKHYADPYVIALAKVHNLAVVTYEKKEMIAICDELAIEHIDIMEVLEREGLTY